MMTVWIGTCAMWAISVMPGRKGLIGARTVRVPSGNSTSCPPTFRLATALRIMPRGGSLRM